MGYNKNRCYKSGKQTPKVTSTMRTVQDRENNPGERHILNADCGSEPTSTEKNMWNSFNILVKYIRNSF